MATRKLTYSRKNKGNPFTHEIANEILDVVAEHADAIDMASGGYIAGIAHNATAPTPGKSGWYRFSSGGSCPFITGGAATVASEDILEVTFEADIYTYKHTPHDSTAQDVFNVTVKVPLSPGSYYTDVTARTAIPVANRKLGLKETHATAAGVWSTQQFIGSDVANWTVEANWQTNTDIALATYTVFALQGFYSSSTGLWVGSSGWRTKEVSNIGIKKINYSLGGGTGAYAIVFLDVNHTVISGLAFTGSNVINGTIVVPTNCVYIECSYATSITNYNTFTIIATNQDATNSKMSKYGDETISDVKTFISSPVVPTPVLDKAAAPKDYADLSGSRPLIQYNSFIDRYFYSGATKTNSSNWCSQTMPVIAGDYVGYVLNSAGGANLITFLNSAGSIVSYITESGIGLSTSQTGFVLVPATAVSAIFTTHLTYLAASSYKIRYDIKNIIPAIPKLITVSKTLTANPATYIFNTIAAALAIASGIDTIYIFDGTYTELSLTLPTGLKMIGVGAVVISGSLPTNSTTALVDASATLNVGGCTLENLTVTAQNMRYPVHSDQSNGKAIQYVTNCRFIHYGNYDLWKYRTDNSIASPDSAAETFRAMSAWGAGTKGGDRSYFKGCYFESQLRGFSTHNNTNFNLTFGASITQLDDCEFVSHGIDFDGTDLGFTAPIVIQHLVSNTDDKVIINNCKANGYLCHNLSDTSLTMKVIGGNNGNLKQIFNNLGSGKTMTDQISSVYANRTYYTKFSDEFDNRKNRTGSTIPAGSAVKKSANSGVTLMTSADSTSLFYGIAMQDILNGKCGDIKVKGYLIRPYLLGLNSTTLTEGDAISVKSDGTFEKTTVCVVMYASDNQNVLIK